MSGKFSENYLTNLIGALFAIVAALCCWLLFSIFSNHYVAGRWLAVSAVVDSAGVKSSHSRSMSRSLPTFNSRVMTSYRYQFKGVMYTGERVDFSFGSDNFADARRARQIDLLRSGSPMVFVDPDNPSNSVLDRSLPIEQINFAIIFLFFPCGLGTATVLGWLAKLAALADWEWPGRFMMPMIGLVHSLPAFYAPFFAPADLGLFGWLLVLMAGSVFLISVRAIWRRIQDPTIGALLMTGRFQR
jgi:hypothetical protein